MASDEPSPPPPSTPTDSDSPPPPSPPEATPPPPSSEESSDSPPPPTPTATPPPSPPASPPPAPPQSPPPKDSSPPPPKEDSPQASPPPPTSTSNPPPPSPPPPSPTPPENSNTLPPPSNSNSPSPPPPGQEQTSPTTPSLTPPLVSAPPAPKGSVPNPVLSPPLSVPGTPTVPSKSSPPSHSTPNANESPSSSSSENSHSPSDSSSANVGIIAGVVIGGFFLTALIVACLVCSRRRRKRPYYIERPPKGLDPYYNGPRQNNHLVKPLPAAGGANGFASPPPQSPGVGGLGGRNQSPFTYEDLAKATGGFSQANLLGQGGFGYVHKGVLPDGRVIAVKSLKSGSGQGEREFQAEVEIISRVHHRHLVSLVGYCIADGQRMLAYEFVANKTLEFHLHGPGRPPMDWTSRLRIALGSAKGLAYLHEDCHPRIIHRDIKTANILIDNNFEAMVADFGLAKLTTDTDTHVSTRVMGTFGYLAPEYAQSGKLSEKSDVFSFGVMLLELITGRKPVDTTQQMEDSLVDWGRPLLAKALEDGKYDALADPRLEGNYNPNEMAQMASCAAASIRHSARRRPKMSQIVRCLQGDSSLDDLNDGVKGGKNTASTVNSSVGNVGYDTGAYNADMMKFRKMIMPSQDFTNSDGGTSEYGLNASSTSSDSRSNSGSQWQN